MAAGNKNLKSAKTARKDEFYTQLTGEETTIPPAWLFQISTKWACFTSEKNTKWI